MGNLESGFNSILNYTTCICTSYATLVTTASNITRTDATEEEPELRWAGWDTLEEAGAFVELELEWCSVEEVVCSDVDAALSDESSEAEEE